jgi:hypothetical protein
MKFYNLVRGAICAVALTGVSGCATVTAPSTDQLARADYGPYPANYEEIVHAYFVSSLKDPSSLQLDTIPVPTKAWYVSTAHTSYGYKTCVRYNARNSYGGYVGYKYIYFLIKNGVVIEDIQNADVIAAAIGIQC